MKRQSSALVLKDIFLWIKVCPDSFPSGLLPFFLSSSCLSFGRVITLSGDGGGGIPTLSEKNVSRNQRESPVHALGDAKHSYGSRFLRQALLWFAGLWKAFSRFLQKDK